MTSRADIDGHGSSQEAAAQWVVRLHEPASDRQAEADWAAFEAWLNSAPSHRAAFDAAEILWREMGRQAPRLRQGLGHVPEPIVVPLASPRKSAGPLWWAAIAAVAASLLVIAGPFSPFSREAPQVYATAKGERMTVILSDGSRIELNGGSRISALVGQHRREVDVAQGSEAAFTVIHDASRPFLVHAGDVTLRDLGTEFDVLRGGDELKVTVRSGLVQVGSVGAPGGSVLALTSGQQLIHHKGAPTSDVMAVNADDAFGWRSGRLIYRDRPLSEVAADLSRYYALPVRASGGAAALRFSGVLAIADESAAINRLAAMVPVSANRQDGAIVLKERTVSR
jgi:transmembrane sensor